jgi:hypothetical protein
MLMSMKSIAMGLVVASMLAHGLYANAACNAVVNGRPMSAQLCREAIAVYGYVTPGRYRFDDAGNWVKLDAPNAGSRGNLYQDARRSHNLDSGEIGPKRYTGGWVGDGYFFDPETGSSIILD